MKQTFNGIDITNVVLYEENSVVTGIGSVSAKSDNAWLENEIEKFLKYLKAKYG